MQAIRSEKTNLEEKVSKELWCRGHRYRRNVKKLTGKPDFAIQKYKVVIFLDSCFWHGCTLHGRLPKSNTDYWENKIARNKQRDNEVTMYYISKGWNILRVWEHQLDADFNKTINYIEDFIQNAKNRNTLTDGL